LGRDKLYWRTECPPPSECVRVRVGGGEEDGGDRDGDGDKSSSDNSSVDLFFDSFFDFFFARIMQMIKEEHKKSETANTL
jgi:hypothetical protein